MAWDTGQRCRQGTCGLPAEMLGALDRRSSPLRVPVSSIPDGGRRLYVDCGLKALDRLQIVVHEFHDHTPGVLARLHEAYTLTDEIAGKLAGAGMPAVRELQHFAHRRVGDDRLKRHRQRLWGGLVFPRIGPGGAQWTAEFSSAGLRPDGAARSRRQEFFLDHRRRFGFWRREPDGTRPRPGATPPQARRRLAAGVDAPRRENRDRAADRLKGIDDFGDEHERTNLAAVSTRLSA